MRNSECTIYIENKNGWFQKYRREKSGWIQISRNGTARPCTAEQVLSHLLPPLTAEYAGRARVRVVRDPVRKD